MRELLKKWLPGRDTLPTPPRECELNRTELKRAVEEDREWRGQFAKSYEAHLRRRGFTHEECEDILQEIRSRAWRGLPSFRGDCSPRMYLWVIAKKVTNTQLRGAIHRREHEQSWDDMANGDEDALDPMESRAAASAEPAVVDQVISRLDLEAWQQGRAEVSRRVAGLENKNYREILALLLNEQERDKYEGSIYEEIAQRTGLHSTQVPMNVQRARERCKKIVLTVRAERGLDEGFIRWMDYQLDLR